MKSKYSINEEVSFLEEYVSFRTQELLYYTLKRGKVIDSTFENGEWFYTVDPWASGHYGHKRYKVPEKFLNPTSETIEECKEKVPVKTCAGWRK